VTLLNQVNRLINTYTKVFDSDKEDDLLRRECLRERYQLCTYRGEYLKTYDIELQDMVIDRYIINRWDLV
jgi:hypothetical protein